MPLAALMPLGIIVACFTFVGVALPLNHYACTGEVSALARLQNCAQFLLNPPPPPPPPPLPPAPLPPPQTFLFSSREPPPAGPPPLAR